MSVQERFQESRLLIGPKQTKLTKITKGSVSNSLKLQRDGGRDRDRTADPCLQNRRFPVKTTHSVVKKRPNRKNLQRICNGLSLEWERRNSNMCKLNGLDGGPGESRTPDQRFRNWAVIPQLVCFQCLQFGQFRAVLGSVGSGTCNGSCNAGRG